MASDWTDKNGDVHTIELDITTAKTLRDECGFDLLSCLSDESAIAPMWQQIADDPLLPIKVLAVLEVGVDPDEFGRLFNGESLRQASHALLKAIANFFQEPQRGTLQKLIKLTTEQHDILEREATSQANQVMADPAFIKVVRESLTHGSGSSASSESSTTTGTA